MVSFTGGNVTYESTLQNLNILDSEYYFRAVDNMLKQDIESSLLLYNEVMERGFDGGNFIAGLASHMRNLLVARDAKTLPLLETSETLRQRYHEQAMRCKPQFLFRAIKLCNDCDLGYRQSRNKRLQVELCLIQATQATEEDSPGAGRRPAKILKPIFKVQAAPQAKPAQRVATKKEEKPKVATLHTLNITTSIKLKNGNDVRTSSNKENREETAKVVTGINANNGNTASETAELTVEGLMQAWQQYANQLPEAEIATAQRMRSIIPQFTGANTFTIVAGNPLVEKDMKKLTPKIEAFIAKQCKTEKVTMTIKIADVDKVVKQFSKPDQFRQALKESPGFARLHELFALELA